jgi:class 3 adenylate cyclase
VRDERRIVTAMSFDVVGSTAMGEQMDPEDVREVIDGAIELLVDAVGSFGGTVLDIAGDGAMAIFGAPVAHEDDAERAVLAGLRVTESVRTYGARLREARGLERFDVRIGIETGLAVLGGRGAGSRLSYSATGDALNTAARLQARAEPGTVLVGEDTYQIVAPLFDWDDPVSLDLKGKAESVRAFRALRDRDGSTRGSPGREAPLIGRQREFAMGVGVLERLAAGEGAVVFVTGEAGIGKSRIIAEWKARAGGVRWLESRCLSYRSTTPMGAFPELLSGLAPGDADPQRVAERLAGQMGSDEVDRWPYLAALLGVDVPATTLSDLAPLAIQFRTVEALGSLFAGVASGTPLVVSVDDLHWADDSSLRALERLLPLSEHHPILFLLVLRNDPGLSAFELLGRLERSSSLDVHVVRLGELEPGSDHALLSSLVGEGVLPASLADRIVQASAGNPLFIEEFVRSLRDEGALVEEGSTWRFARDVDIHVPATVGRIIVSRIDRLDDRSREVLTAASILGRRFSDELLTLILDEGSDVAAALDELIRVDLLRSEFDPSGITFVFAHSLIQEAAYQTLLLKRRRELHMRAVDVLESLEGGRRDDRLGELALHLQGAGEAARALECRMRAARAAMRVSALVEAREHLDVAADLTGEIGGTPDPGAKVELYLLRGTVRGRLGDFVGGVADLDEALREATSAGDDESRMGVLMELGSLRAGASDYRAAIPLLEAALALAERLAQPRAIAGALSRLSIVRTNLLDLQGAFHDGARALEAARESGEEEAVAEALDASELASVMIGDFERVEGLAGELSAIYRRRGEMWYLQYAVFQSFWGPLARGEWDDASRRLDEAQAIAERLRDRGALPLYLGGRSWLERSRGAYGPALSLARRALTIAEELEHGEWQSWGACFIGRAILDAGGGGEAVHPLQRGMEAAMECGSILMEARIRGFLAVALLNADEHHAASEVAAAEGDLLAQVTVPEGGAYIQGADGVLAFASVLARSGEPDRAVALADSIIAPAERCGWIEVAAEAHLVRARVMEQEGAVDEARIAADRTLTLASEHVAPGVAWRAHALLARVRSGDDHAVAARAIVERLSAMDTEAHADEPVAVWLGEALEQALEGGATWV